jgi:hypothetical protein
LPKAVNPKTDAKNAIRIGIAALLWLDDDKNCAGVAVGWRRDVSSSKSPDVVIVQSSDFR